MGLGRIRIILMLGRLTVCHIHSISLLYRLSESRLIPLGAGAPALLLNQDLDDAAGGLIQLARLVFYNVVEV
jgi:hypothetical protein